MERALYKSHKTTRGLSYSYFFSPPTPDARTLLLLHGFPSTAQDWHRIVPALREHGLGVLAPDMLGYGGTDKPLDPAAYVPSLLARDVIEIVNEERLADVVVLGHDWGAMVASRLANLYPERFTGFAFLALGYYPPSPSFDVVSANARAKAKFGYEMLGYWIFNSASNATELLETHWGSFLALAFPANPALWRHHMGPTGAFEQWLCDDRQGPRPRYLDEQALATISSNLRAGGISAPLLWYKVRTSGLATIDEKQIPKSAYTVSKPVFVGVARHDQICVADAQEAQAAKYCPNRCVRRYNGDHWIILSHGDELGRDLIAWVNSLDAGAAPTARL